MSSDIHMELRYEDDFLEAAVFVVSRSRSSLQLRRYHRERERLYLVLDPDDRNDAFFKLHLDWFREWALEQELIRTLDEFPLVRANLNALVFRSARATKDEGAELYVNREHAHSGVVAFRPERFAHVDGLKKFLRHEFTHLHDMLDPAFGYSPTLPSQRQNAAQQRLTRERYRLLWDITIDGRLAGRLRNESTSSSERSARYQAEFNRAFGFWPESRRKDVFDGLWNDRTPHHSDLLALAADPRGINAVHEPAPGAPCPLCGFSTFNWAAEEALANAANGIRSEFPDWSPQQGACRRCVDIYKVLAAQSAALA
jgi:hypothetical protein